MVNVLLTHSVRSLSKIYTRPVFYFCGCGNCIWSQNIQLRLLLSQAEVKLASYCVMGHRLCWTRGKYWLESSRDSPQVHLDGEHTDFETLALLAATTVSSRGSILYCGDGAEYFYLKGQEITWRGVWHHVCLVFVSTWTCFQVWSSSGANLKIK